MAPVAAAQREQSSLLISQRLAGAALHTEQRVQLKNRGRICSFKNIQPLEKALFPHRQAESEECFLSEFFFIFFFFFISCTTLVSVQLQKQHSFTAFAREKHEVEKSE